MRRRDFANYFARLAGTWLLNLVVGKSAWPAWNAEAFASGDYARRFDVLFAGQSVIDSREISLDLPAIAENGAVVPIVISSELDGIDQLYLWVEKNPTPLAARFELSPSVVVFVSARIKMAESCNVVVLARQGSRWLRNRQWVQVMQGGCGTG